MIKEGKVKIKAEAEKNPTRKMKVFYNYSRVIERDMLILFLNSYFKEKFKAIDLLSATGVRALRIAKECNAKEVVANDISKSAFERIKENVKLNEAKIIVFNEEANRLLYLLNTKFDYIDIDPFGSPLKFIDSSIRYVKNKGIIGITATDLPVLFGIKREKCKRIYLANNFIHPFHRETGVRILIRRAIEIGSKYEVALIPVFSFSIKHYIRIYFKVIKRRKEVDKLIDNIAYIAYNKENLERKVVKSFSGKEIGPLFIGEINDKKIIKKMIEENEKQEWKNKEKIKKFLKIALKELNVPYYFLTSEIASKLKINEPKIDDVIKKLKDKIEISKTIFDSKGFKINNLNKVYSIF